MGTITLGLLWWWFCRAADMSKASLWIGSLLRSLRHALLGFRCRFVVFGLSSATHKDTEDATVNAHRRWRWRINDSTALYQRRRDDQDRFFIYLKNLMLLLGSLLYQSRSVCCYVVPMCHRYIVHCSESNSSYVPCIRFAPIRIIRDNSYVVKRIRV